MDPGIEARRGYREYPGTMKEGASYTPENDPSIGGDVRKGHGVARGCRTLAQAAPTG
jgi:hypothetical protein